MDPLHGDDRATKPLFSDSNGAPFSRSQVEAGIKATIQLVVPASDVKKYSFHGYRIYLCTALDLKSKSTHQLPFFFDFRLPGLETQNTRLCNKNYQNVQFLGI